MLPVITFAVVAIPLLVVAFILVRRRRLSEHPSNETAADRLRIEQEFEEAERYQAELRKEQE